MMAGLCLTVVGCGQQAHIPSNAESPEQAHGPGVTADQAQRQEVATRWAAGYCTAVGELVQTLSTMPTVDPAGPEAAVRTSGELLSVMIGGVERTIAELGRLGPAPGSSGDAVRHGVSENLTRIRERAVAAKEKLDDVDPHSDDGLEAIGAVRLPLDELGSLKLLDGFDSELGTATRRAPSCIDLATATHDGAPVEVPR